MTETHHEGHHPPHHERRTPTPEVDVLRTEMTGTSALLILGGDLRPDLSDQNATRLHEISQGKAPLIHTKINEASAKERDTHWEESTDKARAGETPEQTFARQKRAWSKDFDGLLKSYENKSEEIFLENMGITVEGGADYVYQKYMVENEGDIVVFVSDILENHSEQVIKDNMKVILDVGNMYGENSAKIAALLIKGLEEAKRDPDAFTHKARRDIQQGENMPGYQLLTWLNETAPEQLTDTAPPPAEKTPDDTTIPEAQPQETLTPELARTNPEKFKENIIRGLTKDAVYGGPVWRYAVKHGLVGEITIDPDTMESESFDGDKITLGAQPFSDEMKRYFYGGITNDYKDQILYTFGHELSHKIVPHVINRPEYNAVIQAILVFRQQDRNRGLSRLGSSPHHKEMEHEPVEQAKEDLTELINMYIANPSFLKDYLRYLTDESRKAEHEQLGLATITEDFANKLFTRIDTGMKDTLELHRESPQPRPEETPPLSATEIADKLIDYDTGKVTGEKIDLLPSFQHVVQQVEKKLGTNPELFPQDKPVIVLSDVAYAMIDKIAQTGNKKGVELGFGLQGLRVRRDDDQSTGAPNQLDIIGLAVPGSDFENAHSAHVTPDLENIHAPNLDELLQNTNLARLPMDGQHPLTYAHLHPAYLGPTFEGKFSRQDIQVTENMFAREPDVRIFGTLFGVVTKKNNGELIINIRSSYKDENGVLHHEEHLPIVFEKDLQ